MFMSSQSTHLLAFYLITATLLIVVDSFASLQPNSHHIFRKTSRLYAITNRASGTRRKNKEPRRNDDTIKQPKSRENEDSFGKSHFYSRKEIHSFVSQTKNKKSSNLFDVLCKNANIVRPSRIQALSWPVLLQNKHTVIADQTGSGKTLAYLIPLIHNMLLSNTTHLSSASNCASPQILILCPTAELASQVRTVCASLSSSLPTPFRTMLITSSGAPIRTQIRKLSHPPFPDIVVSTPGRIASILRSNPPPLDLTQLRSLVLDEVDVLLLESTFGPQLSTIGSRTPQATQFAFVTATLPDAVLSTIQSEFDPLRHDPQSSSSLVIVKGPGLHKVAPTLEKHLIDVSVAPEDNRDASKCFAAKTAALLTAVRRQRYDRTLIFCNTVETCRKVENFLKRKDRKGMLWDVVGCYHGAASAEARDEALKRFVTARSGGGAGGGGRADAGRDTKFLVCTDRAARGVDFGGVPIDHVVIFDFPGDPAEYVRRVGRTARAGRAGVCTILAYGWQLPIARRVVLGGNVEQGMEGVNFAKDDDDDDMEEVGFKKRRKRGLNKLEGEIGSNIEGGVFWYDRHKI